MPHEEAAVIVAIVVIVAIILLGTGALLIMFWSYPHSFHSWDHHHLHDEDDCEVGPARSAVVDHHHDRAPPHHHHHNHLSLSPSIFPHASVAESAPRRPFATGSNIGTF